MAEQLLYTTVRIEAFSDSGIKSQGTGFLMNYEHEGKNFPFLVTNKHVVEGYSRVSLIFTERINDSPIMGSKCVFDTDDAASFFHCNPDPEIDVAVAFFHPVCQQFEAVGKTLFFRSIQPQLVPDDAAIEALDAIEEVIFVGYPSGLWDEKNLLPIVRKGTTATPVSVDFNGKKQFLIDASIFPGSSGSPVFIYNSGACPDKYGNVNIGTRLLFIGIVSASHIRTECEKVILQTEPSAAEQIILTRQFINLGVVFKYSAIRDTMLVALRAAGEYAKSP